MDRESFKTAAMAVFDFMIDAHENCLVIGGKEWATEQLEIGLSLATMGAQMAHDVPMQIGLNFLMQDAVMGLLCVYLDCQDNGVKAVVTPEKLIAQETMLEFQV